MSEYIIKNFTILLNQNAINSKTDNKEIISDIVKKKYIKTRINDYFIDDLKVLDIKIKPYLYHHEIKYSFDVKCKCEIFRPIVDSYIDAIYVNYEIIDSIIYLYLVNEQYDIYITVKYDGNINSIPFDDNDEVKINILQIDSTSDSNKIYIVGSIYH